MKLPSEPKGEGVVMHSTRSSLVLELMAKVVLTLIIRTMCF
jgi:hypothetical protein